MTALQIHVPMPLGTPNACEGPNVPFPCSNRPNRRWPIAWHSSQGRMRTTNPLRQLSAANLLPRHRSPRHNTRRQHRHNCANALDLPFRKGLSIPTLRWQRRVANTALPMERSPQCDLGEANDMFWQSLSQAYNMDWLGTVANIQCSLQCHGSGFSMVDKGRTVTQ